MKRSTFIFKVFLTVYVHQFGWLSERGGNFLNLLQKEGGRGGGFQHWRKLCHYMINMGGQRPKIGSN